MIAKTKREKTTAIVLATSIAIGGGLGATAIINQGHKIEQLESRNTKLTKELAYSLDELETTAAKLQESNEQLNKANETIADMGNRIEILSKEKEKIEESVKILNQALQKEKEKQKVLPSRGSVSFNKDWETFQSTAYTSFCKEGCTGRTKTGYNVSRNIYYNGMRIIAADPSIIPLYSIVELNVDGRIEKAIVLDTGGAIKGRKIDYLISVRDEKVAFQYGRKTIKIRVVRKGKDGY